jgi:hypothetical protein
VTDFASVIETVHIPAPEQAPPQPAKRESAEAVAVRVTLVYISYDSEQSMPQSMPWGRLVTTPVPVPAFPTVKDTDFKVKVAVTSLAASMVSVQTPVPLQPPLQPIKRESAAGAAARMTTVFLRYVSEQSDPQSIPEGLLATVPLPEPDLLTVKSYVLGIKVKVAITILAADIVTVQVPVPVQSPLQPVNNESPAGTADKVILVPSTRDSEQFTPQSMLAGSEVTVPLPVPDLLTDSSK